MTYWFKPYTHWHEITAACYDCLLRVGYSERHLRKEPT